MKKKNLSSLLLLSLLLPMVLFAKDLPQSTLHKAEKNLPEQCFFYFKMFLHAKGPKAFAYAIDTKKNASCRFSSSSKNQKKANAVALASCQKSAKIKGIEVKCKLYQLKKNLQKTKKQLKFEEKYLINLKKIRKDISVASPSTKEKKLLKKKKITPHITTGSLPKQCLMFYQLYHEAKSYKAFAIARDNDIKYTCKFSAASATMKKAQEVALASCEKTRIKRGIKKPCQLFELKSKPVKDKQKKISITKKTPDKKNAKKEQKKCAKIASSPALEKAILAANLNQIKKLIKHGADINTQAPDKSRALFVAVAQGDITYTKELLKKRAFVFIKKRDGNNLLVAAIMSGSNTMLRLMLEQKIDPNIRCEEGNTPLHFAFMMFDDKMMRTLYAFGARDDIKNAKRKTVQDLAKEFHINLKRIRR